MKRIWLITTDHLEKELWFRDEKDFIVAMNFVAIQAASSPNVIVLAFILMSNHVHFVLRGTRKDVERFINQFRQRYSIYMRNRWGIKEILRGNGVQIKEIPYSDEAVERAVAYVQMNCVAANICSHPSQYPWGTGNCFFTQVKLDGQLVRNMSGRSLERLLHSNYTSLPEDWHITPGGFIPPSDYVDVKSVESLFRSPQRMNYFLKTSSKARKRVEAEENLPAFRDQIILGALPDLCHSLFQSESFQELRAEEKTEFMRQIRFRFSADVNQIARVCGVSYAEAANILDGI